ncbi:MAG: 23S rRNA (guanosine(2251)-2'-O)-methyltransferase RlmB [Bacteroidetes bacterium]|nr:23S rRNA (guanosine(2251)-2'-O)-methyltransferase RlmB [Bacteroidota bacterium]
MELKKKVKRPSDEFMPQYVAGRRAALEMLKDDERRTKIEKVYIAHGVQGPQIGEILHFLRVNKVPFSELDRRKFGELERNVANGVDSQGVLVLLGGVIYWELDDLVTVEQEKGRVVLVALDGIEDPHNIGAIIRSAEALGANGVLIPKRGAALSPAVYKTSAGAALHLPIVKVNNLAETITLLKEDHHFLCLGLAGDGEKEIGQLDTSGNVLLVIGNEEKGMHRLVKERCDDVVKIPLRGKTESLNASVASALAVYQVLSKSV